MFKKTSIMVFRTGQLGDTVCAIPAFRLVRKFFAGAELSLLCDSSQGSLVAATDVIRRLGIFDRIVTYASRRGLLTFLSLARAVHEIRPDIVIILPQERESAKNVRWKKRFFRLCGVPDVRGDLAPVLRHDWHPHEADRMVQMLHSVGVRGARPAYDIPIDAASQESVRARLRAVGVDPELPFLVFCGGGKAPTQHWPIKRYAQVLSRLAAEMKWPIVGLGSPLEVEHYRTGILPQFPDLRLLAGPLTLPEVFELCRLAAVWFGNDTGPMHVAASVGCPVAAVMSARTLPGSWHPDVEPKLVIRLRMDCEGCYLTECVEQQHRCMRDVTVEHVIAEVLPFLKTVIVDRISSSDPRRKKSAQALSNEC